MENFFLVAGDLHLERVQYGLTARFKDNQACIDAILREACEVAECQGLILTGDTFHRKALLPKFQIALQQIHHRLKSAGKGFWGIDGNHDGSDASWLDTIDTQINASGRVIDLGIPAAFFSFQAREQLYERIKQLPEGTKALFLHGRLLELMPWATAQKDPDYDFSAEELRSLGIKGCTVFMGDIHTYCDFFDPVAQNWFIYSGSTEMSEIGEGNSISQRFGNRYDPVKKYLRFFPNRELGSNWECVDLPNRPFLRRVIDAEEDAQLAIDSVDSWVRDHPAGILALQYPDSLREALKPFLPKWRELLLVFFEVPVSKGNAKPLQEMKETDIIEIAEGELSQQQLQILKTVLMEEKFEKGLADLVAVGKSQPKEICHAITET